MILKCKKMLLGGVLLALAIAMAGCSSEDTIVLPETGPEVVAKQFYEFITESKLKGMTPAREAFKLIDSEKANLEIHQFLQIIKRYPPGFMVDVGKAEIKGTQAVVAISFKMASSFGGTYTVEGKLPLNVDKTTHTWKIDFTGDTYGMNKAEFMSLDSKKPK